MGSYNDIESNGNISNIKSNYKLKQIFNHLTKKKSLEIIKYSKSLQKRFNLNIKDYKEYREIFSSIEIEIITVKNKYGKFIKILDKEKEYYHIYFNNKNEEIKRNYITKEDNVRKITIIMDYQVKSFRNLFYDCDCIESIDFKKCHRNNINDMSHMFANCGSLINVNILNLNTNNVTDMSSMFSNCSSLQELNISNFNTNNVIDMSLMFNRCTSLKKLNLSNFRTNKVTDMEAMFLDCSLLKELDISNFNFKNVLHIRSMFYNCSKDLLYKIMIQNKDIKNDVYGIFSNIFSKNK